MELQLLEERVNRLEQRVDRMTETLASKEDLRGVRDDLRDDIKIIHDRLNSQNIFILTGFTVTIASVVITRLLT